MDIYIYIKLLVEQVKPFLPPHPSLSFERRKSTNERDAKIIPSIKSIKDIRALIRACSLAE